MPNASVIHDLMSDCLYGPEHNIRGPDDVPKDAIHVEGVIANFCFDPVKVQKHRGAIATQLAELPDDFHAKHSGDDEAGASFLAMCEDRTGQQWTGLHMVMQELVVLGIAAGLVEYCAPRVVWQVLPGGMPYLRVLARDPRPA
jgi:hypothetical protein